MTETEIKACPFCGSEAILHTRPDGGCSIVCQNTQGGPCDMGSTHNDWRRETVITMWNRRVGDRQPLMPKTPEPSTLASANGYTALELLQTMCELRRNMDCAVDEINGQSYSRAALYLECAASKLRTIQRAIDAV